MMRFVLPYSTISPLKSAGVWIPVNDDRVGTGDQWIYSSLPGLSPGLCTVAAAAAESISTSKSCPSRSTVQARAQHFLIHHPSRFIWRSVILRRKKQQQQQIYVSTLCMKLYSRQYLQTHTQRKLQSWQVMAFSWPVLGRGYNSWHRAWASISSTLNTSTAAVPTTLQHTADEAQHTFTSLPLFSFAAWWAVLSYCNWWKSWYEFEPSNCTKNTYSKVQKSQRVTAFTYLTNSLFLQRISPGEGTWYSTV